MTNLTRASHELFRRTPDETFPSLEVFQKHFQWQREAVRGNLATAPDAQHRVGRLGERLMLDAGNDRSVSK